MRPLRPMLLAASLMLGASGLAVSGGAALAAPSAPAGLERQIVWPAAGSYVLDLENVRGRIAVRSWNYNLVHVQARPRAERALAGDEAAAFSRLRIDLKEPAPGSVALSTRVEGERSSYPAVLASRMPHVAVDYVVTVPPGTLVRVRQEHGPVTLFGLSGRAEVFSRDGDVVVERFKGRAEATTERGALRFTDIDGDAVGRSFGGAQRFSGVSGDIEATSGSGAIDIQVDPRFAGEVAFHTVRGVFRSDLASFDTDMRPGETGYVGVLRGPLAGSAPVAHRFVLNSVGGDASVAVLR